MQHRARTIAVDPTSNGHRQAEKFHESHAPKKKKAASFAAGGPLGSKARCDEGLWFESRFNAGRSASG
jgi:hypothetical protein